MAHDLATARTAGALTTPQHTARLAHMSELPAGTVTFLFTDLEGSTRLLEAQPEPAATRVARAN